MLTRFLAVLGVGIWCVFLMVMALGLIVDRGLADVGIAWLGLLGIGVAAPVLLLQQLNRAIATHEESRRAMRHDEREKERELFGALENFGSVTPAAAAMRTSLTVDEAALMLDRLASKGHLRVLDHDGSPAYALPGEANAKTPELTSADEPGSPAFVPREEAPVEPLAEPLSEREMEVLSLLSSGHPNKEVARELFVSVGTVKTHTNNIYRKLGVRNRAEALARARALRLL